MSRVQIQACKGPAGYNQFAPCLIKRCNDEVKQYDENYKMFTIFFILFNNYLLSIINFSNLTIISFDFYQNTKKTFT